MIEIPLNKTLVPVETHYDNGCRDCIFDTGRKLCEMACQFTCGSSNREDGKNVIFKLVDIQQPIKHEEPVSCIKGGIVSDIRKYELKVNYYEDRASIVKILAFSGYKVSIEEREGKHYRDKDYYVIVETKEPADD